MGGKKMKENKTIVKSHVLFLHTVSNKIYYGNFLNNFIYI